ncbi:ATPase [Sulfuricaulis limicola]|uniref:ATPase n=1 Tax=Sulfuricaulis limicola TaxID=1620215 RepID=A0A1B4XIR2_9GAMM|nr:SRPBCC family protein [Sulfuricaulis limicola]BAV34674.1 ATPase [Sulfuricaulis limicola]
MNQAKQHPTAIRLTRRFRAPRRRVFDAWLDPGLAGRWLFATATRPMAHVEIDARVGGRFRLAEQRNGASTEHFGQYVEIVPPRRLVFTLREQRHATRVTVEINPRRRGCELRLHHENLPPERTQDAEARWSGMLYGLGVMLASRPGQTQDPE